MYQFVSYLLICYIKTRIVYNICMIDVDFKKTIVLDFESRSALVNGENIKLTSLEFRLICIFYKKKDWMQYMDISPNVSYEVKFRSNDL